MVVPDVVSNVNLYTGVGSDIDAGSGSKALEGCQFLEYVVGVFVNLLLT